jgi:hypothetical protein
VRRGFGRHLACDKAVEAGEQALDLGDRLSFTATSSATPMRADGASLAFEAYVLHDITIELEPHCHLVAAERIVALRMPRTFALKMTVVARRLVVVEDDALVELAH